MNALTVKNEIIPCKAVNLNELINRFVRFVDVSPSSVRAYLSGVKAFIRYLSKNSITQPTRENLIDFKKAYLLKKRKHGSFIFIVNSAFFLHGVQVRIYTVIFH